MLIPILLDVDGVLVHSASIEAARTTSREPEGSSFYYAAQVDPLCAARLLRLFRAAEGVRWVLCSEWRRWDSHRAGLKRALYSAGFDRMEVRMDATPYLGQFKDDARRTEECKAYLATWNRAQGSHLKPEEVLVLDDGIVSGFHQAHPRPNHFTGGLQDSHVEEAIAFLQAKSR